MQNDPALTASPQALPVSPRLTSTISILFCALSAMSQDFVTVLGGDLRIGEKPGTFVCASGLSPAFLGEPLPESTKPIPGEDAATDSSERLLARRLALAGFDMVSLPDLAVPCAGDPTIEARIASQDAFVAACKKEGIRIWAEVLHPVSCFVPSPSDVDTLDEPATRDAWSNAVAEASASGIDLSLAASWDPRLEVLLQRRLRDWARAFNPETGLRRCDDPVYALFSFSSLWWEVMNAPDRRRLPDFFEEELQNAWNNYLYNRHGSDEVVQSLFPLLAGETLSSNSVAFLSPGTLPNKDPRAREERIFLLGLHMSHMRRLLGPFASFGQASRTAPRLVRQGGSIPVLKTLSSIGLSPEKNGDSPRPWIADGSTTAASLSKNDRASGAGASVLVLPCGDELDAWATAAIAAKTSPAAFESAAFSPCCQNVPSYDVPNAAHAEIAIPAHSSDNPSVAAFPAAGVQIVVQRVTPGKTPDFPEAFLTNGVPHQFLVFLPDDETAESEKKILFTFFRPNGAHWSELRVQSESGSDAIGFTVLARGTSISKRTCVPIDETGAEQTPIEPVAGVFRHEAPSGSTILLFRPPPIGSAILRSL